MQDQREKGTEMPTSARLSGGYWSCGQEAEQLTRVATCGAALRYAGNCEWRCPDRQLVPHGPESGRLPESSAEENLRKDKRWPDLEQECERIVVSGKQRSEKLVVCAETLYNRVSRGGRTSQSGTSAGFAQ